MIAASSGGVRLGALFADVDPQCADIEVADVTTHSGLVVRGGLFLACQGYEHHGLEFVDAALAAKPAAVAWEPTAGYAEPSLPANVAGLRIEGLADQVGEIADRFFAMPSAQMKITGITGTNGKTTTAWLVSRALNILGRKSAYMGTLGYGMGDRLNATELTTPACITVHHRLRELADSGAECVIMEVSSHGLDQGRVDGVRLATTAFTNLSRDHLDYHGDFDSYADAKAKLFSGRDVSTAIINIGDDFGAKIAAGLNSDVKLISVALSGTEQAADAMLVGEVRGTGPAGLLIHFSGEFGSADLHSKMWGTFNAENLLVAAGILVAHGFELGDAVAALSQSVAPPGRMQVIEADDRPVAVVDFAHTPDALAKALQSLRAHCRGKVWVVFGCGGERDQGKRPQMGEVAAQLADRVVVTSDNPRNEDSQQIVADILGGMADSDTVMVESDRRTAIKLALDGAASGDAVLIAGKGSESHQLIGDQALAFSDIVVASEHLRGLS
jgi:UDP-N-acetylmuramoyl-L-alanyl-D-glutamate--2,6-diaminopimelate ligase